MTALALVLVLSAAVIHATWNYLAKRIGVTSQDGWLFAALAVIVYAPVVVGIVLWRRPVVGGREVFFMAGTAILHTAYFLLLFRGYQAGALSVVYPLARGTGPLLSTVGAVAFFGERPTWLAVAGATMIGLGVFVLAGDPRRLTLRGSGQAVVYALITGGVIALYTLWDKYAVSVVGIHPLLLDWGSSIGRTVLLTPLAVRHWDSIRARVRTHPFQTLAVAVLTPLAYIFVLTALAFTPVSYVAPLREVSILAGAAMGARLLSEGDVRKRLVAAAVMVIGAVLLSVG
ncbi:MAG: DMT family transporter [Armatimonadota bacterium]|nr:DMT family transporter [Armatimonadota bacterium]MDR7548865.1 DMT family transporter [Armatimonadota bacterium]